MKINFEKFMNDYNMLIGKKNELTEEMAIAKNIETEKAVAVCERENYSGNIKNILIAEIEKEIKEKYENEIKTIEDRITFFENYIVVEIVEEETILNSEEL